MHSRSGLGINRALAVVAMTLATLALIAGSPDPSSQQDSITTLPGDWLAVDPQGIDVIEVATWIRDREPGLNIIDLRSAEEFEAFHLPTARHAPLHQLAASDLASFELTVLYGASEEQVMRGLVLLRTLGVENVHILDDGVGEWLRRIINPTLYQNPSMEEERQYERSLDISAYYGGLARRDVARSSGFNDSTEKVLQSTMRRGCSF